MTNIQVAFCLVLLAVGVMSQDYNDFFLPQNAQQGQGNGRASRGPVLFPTSPEGTETSGVVVGASGYGFVPPGRQRAGPIFKAGRGPQSFGIPSGPQFGGFF